MENKLTVRNGIFRTIARPELDSFPEVELPVYLRGAGHFILKGKSEEFVPAGVKQFVQLFWGVSGTGEFILPDGPSLLGPGDVVFRLPGEEHHLRSGGGEWIYRWIAFDGKNARDFMLDYGYPHVCFHAESCPHELFLEAEQLLRDRSPFAWREMVAVIARILARAGGRHDDSTREGRLVNRFIRLCRENIGSESVNVNVLAELLEIDRSTLRRIIRKRLLISPGKYLQQLRIQYALNLLQTSELSVAEVAEQSGFANVSHFCRMIREATGFSPGEYRNHPGGRY